MKQMLALIALGGALSLGAAHATTTPAQAAQQNTMKTCNAEAKTEGLKGDAHAAFMKTCLSKHAEASSAATTKPAAAATASAAPAPASSQQSKMKTCNEEAKVKALKGEAHKSFMSTCLKG